MYRQIAVFVFLFFAFGCGEEPVNLDNAGSGDSIVITVGDRTIPGSRLAPVLERLQGDSLIVNLKIEGLINRLLILQDAHDRGIDSSREIELFTYERERDKLESEWLSWFLEQYVQLPENAVEEFYSQMGTTLIYSSLTVESRALCDSLKQLVSEGEKSIAELIEGYSVDTVERVTEGRQGPVDLVYLSSTDSTLLHGLEAGEVSTVDSSDSGWRFLRLDSLYQDSLPPVEEIREQIAGRLLNKLRMEYREQLFDSLRTANNLQIEEGIPELIASHYPGNGQLYTPFTLEQENMAAYTYNGGETSLYILVSNISCIPSMPGFQPGDPEWIESHIQLIGLHDIMAMEARKQGMDTLPQVVSYVDQNVGNRVLDDYYALVIEPRLLPTEVELMEIYETEMDTVVIPEERVFKTISAVGREQVNLLQQVFESEGDPFSMTEEFTTVQSIVAPGESIVTVPMMMSSVPPPWNEMLFSAEMNETVLCSIDVQRILLFEVIEIRPEHIATFEESQSRLTDIYKTAEEEDVISGLVDSLSSVYHIEIDREFVDSFIYADSTAVEQ